MQILKNKIASLTIAVLFIISMTASLTLMPNALGQTGLIPTTSGASFPTFGYINVAPNPDGVNQPVTLNIFLAVPLQSSEFATNMTIHVTLPDGTTTTLGPYTSDATGGTSTLYTPEQTGNYSFYMQYGGQKLTVGTYAGDFEEPCTSATVTLMVQSAPISGVPFTPLPTQYWQTPVNAMNVQNWYSISGPWLGLAAETFATTGAYNDSAAYNPYTAAPTTGHILWTKPWIEGGAVGGLPDGTGTTGTETDNFWATCQYEPKWAPVVMNGICYSTWYTGTTSDSNGIVAYNLYNGQTMWILNTTNALRCGMLTYWESPNQYGYVGPYIWTTGNLAGNSANNAPGATEWNMYDALTGEYILSVVNGTALTLTTDPNGNLIGYYVNATVGTEIINPNSYTSKVQTNAGATLNCFNMTLGIGQNGGQWTPALNSVHSWNAGLMWSQPIPTELSGIPGYGLNAIASGVAIMTGGFTFGQGVGGETNGWLVVAGFDANTGINLWIQNYTETPFTRTTQTFGDGYFFNTNENTFVIDAYAISTGTLAWTATLTNSGGGVPNPYDEFNTGVKVANGDLICWGFGGDIWCVNWTNGSTVWYTNTTSLVGGSGTETPYGIWPLWVFSTQTITNNILYIAEGHEYDPPLFHGAQELAINLTNGQLVWGELAFDTTGSEVSYGILQAFNAYDGQVYAYGQGPSKTTVAATEPVGTVGSPMVITGTVTDVSAGASQAAVAADFPNGLPCVSDASQSAWMAYVYEQQPHPSNVAGVTVDLTSVDPNGNTVPIGTTTSDASGTFGVTWTPPIAGNYTIIATFTGSGAYYGSYAETHVYAGNPPATASPVPTPVSQATTQSYVLGIGIAMIVIIIVIGAVLALLLLRKRP